MSTRSLSIKNLSLADIGCFQKIDLNFSERFNLICGANGVGKSTVLTVIARAFSHHQSPIKKRAAAKESGQWFVNIFANGKAQQLNGFSDAVSPDENDSAQNVNLEAGRHLLFFKANRDFLYRRLDNIARDPLNQSSQWSQAAILGVTQDDTKRWFANRYLFSAHQSSLTDDQLDDLSLAIRCFSLLDNKVEFDTIDAATFDIIVKTSQGHFPYEYLSSGYRASLAMLLGIIREIETRGLDRPAREFDGVILIDELDLHLHPTWQREIVSALREAFPRAQFIATTHSPHMIQLAEPNEVHPLVNINSEATKIARLEVGRFGFKGWTIEEILRDVMGLADIETTEFRETMRNFDRAVDKGSEDDIELHLEELDSMLHPANHLRKLLRLQAAAAVKE